MFRIIQHRRLTITSIIITPSLLLLLLITAHLIPLASKGSPIIFGTPTNTNIGKLSLQLSSDPYTNSNSQHQTELEPSSFSFDSTIVTAFQADRFVDAASSNIGWATSVDNGATWRNGFLPGTTLVVDGPFTRVSDPSVAYDAAPNIWIISSVAVFGNGSTLASPTIIVNISTNGGLSWNSTIEVAKITGSVLPSAGIDAAGKVYLVWVDCQFEKGCSGKGGEDLIQYNVSQGEDDLVMSTSDDGIHWSPVQLIPIDPLGSGIDHIVPGLGVDKHTSESIS